MITGAAEISMRIMALSNQGLLSYTPDQLLPDDNPDLSFLVATAVVKTLACDLLEQDARYKNQRQQLEATVRAIMAQSSDSQITIDQINQAITNACETVVAENQEIIKREAEKRIPKALEFIKDKYKIRFECMMSSLVVDSISSVSPIAVGHDLVNAFHALQSWVVQEDLKLPKKEGVGVKPDYNLAELPDHYHNLREIWTSAKRDAQKAQKNHLLRANWRKRIQASYSYDLPDDLIEWLNENEQEKRAILEARIDLKFLPQKLKKGLELCKPSEIALEHSARLCGVPPYYYSLTWLFEVLREKQALWFKSPA